MIEFRHVCKHYPTTHGRKVVLEDFSLTLPAGAKVGVLGRNGAGKSTLLGMVAGTVRPDRGEIRRHAAISWPLGFGGSFQADLTGVQNVRFVARIYGIDTDALVAYVEDFAELGEFLDMPVRAYSSGMKRAARLRHVDGHRLRLVPGRRDHRRRRRRLQAQVARRLQAPPEGRGAVDGVALGRHHPALLHQPGW